MIRAGQAGPSRAPRPPGFASMPASVRWASVIGVGAPVSGSKPAPVFGKAMTSRIDSTPVSSADSRSQPERGAGVRRRAVGERLEEEPEPLAGLLAGHAEGLEDPLLQRGVVDTHRAAHHLVAVDHHVVGVGQRRALVLGEALPPLRAWAR